MHTRSDLSATSLRNHLLVVPQNLDMSAAAAAAVRDHKNCALLMDAVTKASTVQDGPWEDTVECSNNIARSILGFVMECVWFAKDIVEDNEILEEEADEYNLGLYREETIRIITLGMLSCDNPGFITSCYERYVCDEIMACFDSETGLRMTRRSGVSTRRQRSLNPTDGRSKTARATRRFQGESYVRSTVIGDGNPE